MQQKQQQRFIDELQWFEMGPLLDISGQGGENAWIASTLSEQLSGQRLHLLFADNQLQTGEADIELEYDNFPLPTAWNSPPGELVLEGSTAQLSNSITYSHINDGGAGLALTEEMQLSGSFLAETAGLVMLQARDLRREQDVAQTNPETIERWLLGRSLVPMHVRWEFSGTLGGLPFSFSASQQLIAVSSYYEVTIIEAGQQSGEELLQKHHSLLAAGE